MDCSRLHRPYTVSYTHLDVYKRQPLLRKFLFDCAGLAARSLADALKCGSIKADEIFIEVDRSALKRGQLLPDPITGNSFPADCLPYKMCIRDRSPLA